MHYIVVYRLSVYTMEYNCYQIDAFTSKIFGGNPACVVPLKKWLPDNMLSNIAKENAVAETAFFIQQDGTFYLRWFTPNIEMDLCGHATLATAHCLYTILKVESRSFPFITQSGELTVTVQEDNLYSMDFPSRVASPATLPDIIAKSLSSPPKEVYRSRDYLLVYASEDEVRNIEIDRSYFDGINLDPGGVIVTSIGDNCDFVSRFFTPQSTILEDPVTGSAHCTLIPYWSDRLNKNSLHALQVSERGGELFCENKNDRVLISGSARTYFIGKICIE